LTARERIPPREGASNNLLGYVWFWLLAALVLLALGIATLTSVEHARRIGLALIVLAVGCLALAYVIRRAALND
jgi:hypothetical protein